jgi:hypothetical protein
MSFTRACGSKLTRSVGNGGPCHLTSHGVPPSPLPRAKAPIEGGPLAYLVSRHPGLGRGPPDQGPERRELRPIGGRQMLLDRLDGLDDVRVRVEDTIAAACHQRSSLNK